MTVRRHLEASCSSGSPSSLKAVRNKESPTVFGECDLDCLACFYVFDPSLSSFYLCLPCWGVTSQANKFVTKIQVLLHTAIRFNWIKSILDIMIKSKLSQILKNSLNLLLLIAWATCDGCCLLIFVRDLEPKMVTNKTLGCARIHLLIPQVFKRVNFVVCLSFWLCGLRNHFIFDVRRH